MAHMSDLLFLKANTACVQGRRAARASSHPCIGLEIHALTGALSEA